MDHNNDSLSVDIAKSFFDILLAKLDSINFSPHLFTKENPEPVPYDSVDSLINDAIKTGQDEDVFFDLHFQKNFSEPLHQDQEAETKTATVYVCDIEYCETGEVNLQQLPAKATVLSFIESLSPIIVVDTGDSFQAYYSYKAKDEEGQDANIFRYIIDLAKEKGFELNEDNFKRPQRIPGTYNHLNTSKKQITLRNYSQERGQIENPHQNQNLAVHTPPPARSKVKAVQRPIATPNVDITSILSTNTIIENCTWMKFYTEKTNSRPDNIRDAIIYILSGCIEDKKMFIRWSVEKLALTSSEAEKRITDASEKAKSINCRAICSSLEGKGFCEQCPFWTIINSPVQLCEPDIVSALRSIVSATEKSFLHVFENNILDSFRTILEKDKIIYNRIMELYKEAGLPTGVLESVIKGDFSDVLSDTQSFSFGNAIYNLKVSKKGCNFKKLTNFDAWIAEEITLDDDIEKTITFTIYSKSENGSSFPPIEVEADKFDSMKWVTSSLGSAADIRPGAREHTRSAIKNTGANAIKINAYKYTGWKKIDDQWVYLTTAGGISEKGLDKSIRVLLPDNLINVHIPVPDVDISTAVKASLRIFDLVPISVAAPIISSIYRAPLDHLEPIDYSLFMVGGSGGFKSEIAALAMAHWGKGFKRKTLPGDIITTPNENEKRLYFLKDGLFVYDDYLEDNPPIPIVQMRNNLNRIIRSVGNRAARGRMTSAKTYYPRSQVLITAEVIPEGINAKKGISSMARIFVINNIKGTADVDVLTEMQGYAASGLLSAAMFYYIQWLSSRIDEWEPWIKNRIQELRTDLRQDTQGNAEEHARKVDTRVSLIIGYEVFSKFMLDNHIFSEEEIVGSWQTVFETLTDRSNYTQENYAQKEPHTIFVELLTDELLTGKAHLINISKQPLIHSNRWGYPPITNPPSHAGKQIGWIDGRDVYFLPDLAWEIVERSAQEKKIPLATTKTLLQKSLKEHGITICPSSGRLVEQKVIKGIRHNVLHILASTLYPEEVIAVNNTATVKEEGEIEAPPQ